MARELDIFFGGTLYNPYSRIYRDTVTPEFKIASILAGQAMRISSADDIHIEAAASRNVIIDGIPNFGSEAYDGLVVQHGEALYYRTWDEINSGKFVAGTGIDIDYTAGKITISATGEVTSVEEHNFLNSTAHPDTITGAPVRGDLIVGSTDSTPKWTRKAIGSNGYFLKSNGTDAGWAAHGLGHADVGACPALSLTDNVMTKATSTTTIGDGPLVCADDNSYAGTLSNFGVGVLIPDRKLHSEISDSATNTIVYPLRVSHLTSATPTSGFGVGIEFEHTLAIMGNRVLSSIVSSLGSPVEARLHFNTWDSVNRALYTAGQLWFDGYYGRSMLTIYSVPSTNGSAVELRDGSTFDMVTYRHGVGLGIGHYGHTIALNTSAYPGNTAVYSQTVKINPGYSGTGLIYNHSPAIQFEVAQTGHGVTTILPTQSMAAIYTGWTSDTVHGGLCIDGITYGDLPSLRFRGVLGPASPTSPAIQLIAGKKSGTGYTDLAAAEVVLRLYNHEANILTILGSGNLGLNTAAPAYLLDCNGTARFSIADAATNTVVYPLTVEHYSASTTTDAFGVGIKFKIPVYTGGAPGEISLYATGGGLRLTSDNMAGTGLFTTDDIVAIRGLYLANYSDNTYVSSDNQYHLDLNATTAIDLNAATINLCANQVYITGAALMFTDDDTEVIYSPGSGVEVGKLFLNANREVLLNEGLVAEADGTLRFDYDATVFDDLQFPIDTGKTPAAHYPSWEAFGSNQSAHAFAVDDYIDLQANEPFHGWKEGGTLDFHLHVTTKYAQVDGSNRFAKFQVFVSYCDTNNSIWVDHAALTGEVTIPTGTASRTGFYVDVGDIDLSGYHIGCQVKVRVKRIAATGGTEYGSTIFITQCGAHLIMDTIGSRTETGK
jgi:hypothetical protein